MVVEKKRLRRPKKAPQPLKEITNLTKALFLFVPMIISFIAYNVLYVHMTPASINTPHPSPSIAAVTRPSKSPVIWGSYRPGVYFGMKARLPFSPVFGLMWMSYEKDLLRSSLRHWCDAGDELKFYSWTQHDGRTFGKHRVIDKSSEINASFIIADSGEEWTNRIAVKHNTKKDKSSLMALFYYVALDSVGVLNMDDPLQHALNGYTSDLGEFSLNLHIKNKQNVLATHYLASQAENLAQLSDITKNTMQIINKDVNGRKLSYLALGGRLVVDYEKQRIRHLQQDDPVNFIIFQIITTGPIEVDVVFESKNATRQRSLVGDVYTSQYREHEDRFEAQFEQKFKLTAKAFPAEERTIAKSVFSNLIGGIGYFYGTSRVQSSLMHSPINYWPAELLTAVPSRPFFPRGFLWDEGFHNLLIGEWDRDISKDIIAHWLDLMNDQGWIPREQILGSEAVAKVPMEFLVQRSENANPPTLFLALSNILKESTEQDNEFFKAAYPRLKQWYSWFNDTQKGEIPTSYQWKGRNATTNRELNPKTLTSGLDDYPRASHPSEVERHLDLRCWMSLGAKVMASIGRKCNAPPHEIDAYDFDHKTLSDNQLLDDLHWSEKKKRYSDYGLHSDNVKLVRPKVQQKPGEQPIQLDMIRIAYEVPNFRFIDSTFGYVSLFPLITKIITPNSSKLLIIFKDLRNTDLLWTPYGLRSLARVSPLYNKRNTEHDPPYWRGAIWINLNYLTVSALHHYAAVCQEPQKTLAHNLYVDLRSALLKNMLAQYKQTGAVWEQYNDVTGKGQGTRPFTGWSSLLVSLMAEHY